MVCCNQAEMSVCLQSRNVTLALIWPPRSRRRSRPDQGQNSAFVASARGHHSAATGTLGSTADTASSMQVNDRDLVRPAVPIRP
jgi:hypothetical protein